LAHSLDSLLLLIASQVAAILPSICIVALRILLVKENKRRDRLQEIAQVRDDGVVETVDDNGTTVTHVVDNNQLDLTDRENLTL
jgi:hypothetical protein